jgi:hypothetical protein
VASRFKRAARTWTLGMLAALALSKRGAGDRAVVIALKKRSAP